MEKSEIDKSNDSEEIDPLEMEDRPPRFLKNSQIMDIQPHHVLRRPEELISFRDLLLRWWHNSFYNVSYCIGAFDPETVENDKLMYAMRVNIAKRIAVETTRLDISENDKNGIKNRHELRIILAKCKKDPSLKTFPLFCTYFNLLYFDIADVEDLEQRFRQIRWTDPSIQNKDPLYTTTKENINRVAPLALYYWHCINGTIGTGVSYCDRTQKIPSYKKDYIPQCVSWKLDDGIHYPSGKLKKYTELSAESVSPTLPFEMPTKFKRSRKNEIREYRPLIEQLEALGIDDVKNRAKITYSLFSQLSHGEIGRMFPASSYTKTSKQTDRDRGRWLLGLHGNP